jgi:hypothetical protein
MFLHHTACTVSALWCLKCFRSMSHNLIICGRRILFRFVCHGRVSRGPLMNVMVRNWAAEGPGDEYSVLEHSLQNLSYVVCWQVVKGRWWDPCSPRVCCESVQVMQSVSAAVFCTYELFPCTARSSIRLQFSMIPLPAFFSPSYIPSPPAWNTGRCHARCAFRVVKCLPAFLMATGEVNRTLVFCHSSF